MKSRRNRIILVLFVLIAVLGTGLYVFMHRGEESTDDAAIDGRIVTISPKISGYVKTLNIDDNQQVKAGDVLLEIDPTDYINKRDAAAAAMEAALSAAQASQSNRETTDISAPSNLDAAQAQVASAQANWDKAVADLRRMTRLTNEARSQEQLDAAVAAEKAAKSALEDAQARLRSAETAPKAIAAAAANSAELLAKAKQAQADLAQAEEDLANTKIIAPMDGYITRRGVERGDYVQPGQDLGSLVGTDIWVTANFKETQLDNMHPGDRVTITVDAFPNLALEGKIDSIQDGTGARFSAFPPENATGNFVKIVQRVPVKITFTKPAPDSVILGPGMSVIPTVHTLDTANDGDGAAKDQNQ
jgi:membrane fusion protein (multidrug efflux system)